MAFQGIVSSTISNENSVQGTVANAVYLTATPASVKYIIGVPGLNVLEVIDVYDYFRTEDNKHFLVTEDGNYLVI